MIRQDHLLQKYVNGNLYLVSYNIEIVVIR